jgi:hypothetical protein
MSSSTIGIGSTVRYTPNGQSTAKPYVVQATGWSLQGERGEFTPQANRAVVGGQAGESAQYTTGNGKTKSMPRVRPVVYLVAPGSNGAPFGVHADRVTVDGTQAPAPVAKAAEQPRVQAPAPKPIPQASASCITKPAPAMTANESRHAKLVAVLGLLGQAADQLNGLGELGHMAAVRGVYVAVRGLAEAAQKAAAGEHKATRDNGRSVTVPNVNAPVADAKPAPVATTPAAVAVPSTPKAAAQTVAAPPTKTDGRVEYRQLRETCKGLGIKTVKGDNRETLRAKIDAHKAASAAPAAQTVAAPAVKTGRAAVLYVQDGKGGFRPATEAEVWAALDAMTKSRKAA